MPKGLAPGEAGFSVIIDPAEWYRFKKRADEVGAKDIPRILRKRIKTAGSRGVEAVRRELALPSPDNGADTGQGRAAIAAATRLTTSFSARSAGVRIVSAASRLPAEHKGLLLAYNRGEFRHPIFDRSGVNPRWVVQHGRPYFGAAILKAMDHGIYDEINSALEDAQKALASRTGA